MLEEELISGDYVMASQAAMSHASQLIAARGIDELVRLMRPMLDRSREDASLEKQLGQLLIAEGALERGATFLRVALDHDLTRSQRAYDASAMVLIDALIALGELGPAHRRITEVLGRAPGDKSRACCSRRSRTRTWSTGAPRSCSSCSST